MNKKAAIKRALREVLVKRPDTLCTIERPQVNVSSISFGTWSLDLVFSEYNDDGDFSTDPEHDEIYSALEQIVLEHNIQS